MNFSLSTILVSRIEIDEVRLDKPLLPKIIMANEYSLKYFDIEFIGLNKGVTTSTKCGFLDQNLYFIRFENSVGHNIV